MSTITLHNESENQLELIKTLLKELKIKFDISKSAEKEEMLSNWQREKLEKGIEQANNGEFYNQEEANKLIEECFK